MVRRRRVGRARPRPTSSASPCPRRTAAAGYGILEACLIAEQVGRTVAPVPYLSSIVASAMPVAAVRLATRSASSCCPTSSPAPPTLTVALYEPSDVAVPAVPTTQATADGDGWRLDGEKSLVVGADRAAAILVPARTARVDLGRVPRRARRRRRAPSTRETRRDRRAAVDRAARRRRASTPTRSSATRPTGRRDRRVDHRPPRRRHLRHPDRRVRGGAAPSPPRYVSEREQFGSKLGTFQAVGQRVADAYIDTEAIRLTALQAAWRLSEGLDAARRADDRQVLGRRRRASGSSTPPSTCTAASASTSTTRSTATSGGPRSSSSPSAGRARRSCASGASLATQPVGGG